jgi:hypothetical protein
VIIDPETRQVLQDVYRYEDLLAWLHRDFELKVQAKGSDQHVNVCTGGVDLSKMQPEELTNLLRDIADEQDHQRQK